MKIEGVVVILAVLVAVVSSYGYNEKTNTRSKSAPYYRQRARSYPNWNGYKVDHTKTKTNKYYPEPTKWNGYYEEHSKTNEYYPEHTKTVTKWNKYAPEKSRSYPLYRPHKEITNKHNNEYYEIDGYGYVPSPSSKKYY